MHVYIFYDLTAFLGLGLLIFEVSKSHSETLGSVGLLWKRDRSISEKSTYTTHNIHERQTSMLPVGFEPTTPASERPQTHALDRAATGIGIHVYTSNQRNYR